LKVRVSVIGAGVVGLATTHALQGQGVRAQCLESVGPMSQRSSGSSRIFRHAHGDPALVELAIEAGRRYRDWAAEAGQPLLSECGTVIAGDRADGWAQAMAEAGAELELVEGAGLAARLPVRALAGRVLLDPAGGVIDAAAVGEFLVRAVGPALVRGAARRVEAVPGGVRVHHDGGVADCDACVIVAGAHTGELAAQVGLAVPSTLAHHVRFTFPMPPRRAAPACLIERGESWRRGFTSYQHQTAPGRWAVGAHLSGELGSAGSDRAEFVAVSRRVTQHYVRENLPGLGTVPVDELYCDVLDGWGDGFVIQRRGAVLTLHGSNLFKFAPVLGRILARAAMDGSTPRSWEPVGT
jgi:sarcosine oxidase